ncbi:DUF2490 domain-containing protein [Flavobacterium sp.]|uniref:DUF2490 domain-containing protein n=1 Tax=Flavobacterium sp. TaxID=239 RepID=UPI0026367D5E|nr:DUF2490 domain-containing protein [Flavobacterium sp.]MDD3005055.1 DUF2490 domain-containing protein [Flavobacterium sp.]
MKDRLKGLIVAIAMISANHLYAQTHYNTWFRTTLSVPVGEKFKIDNEVQYRSQNGFENTNGFDKKLMIAYRNWLFYQPNKDVKFSISPFAYFSNYKIIQTKTDETAKPQNEIRFSAAVEIQQSIVNKVNLVNRTAIEYRMFENNQTDITRLRNRLGLKYALSEKIKFSVFDELLVLPSKTAELHFFDQNRMGVSLDYKLFSNLKVDIGYLYMDRLPVTSTNKIHENNIFMNVMYRFKKV